jgi:hypothetical protein
LTPIFFRIHIEQMTGHRATFDRCEAVPTSTPLAYSYKRGWLGKLLNL